MNDYLLTLKPRGRPDQVRLALAAIAFLGGIVVLALTVHVTVQGSRVDCGTPFKHWFSGASDVQECTRMLSGRIVRAAGLFFPALMLALVPIFAAPVVRLCIVIVAVFSLANLVNAFGKGGIADGVVAVACIATAIYLGRRLNIDQ